MMEQSLRSVLGPVLTLLLGVILGSCMKPSEKDSSSSQGKKIGISSDLLEDLDDYDNPLTQVEAEKISGTPTSSADDDEDINDVLPLCGVDDLSDRDASIFSTKMNYEYTRIIDSGVAIANVGLNSKLDLIGSLNNSTLDVKIDIGTLAAVDTNGQPYTDIAAVQQRAENISTKFIGYAKSFRTPNNSNFHKDWKNVVCTMLDSNKMENTRGGFFTIAEFTPSFVPNVSPIADEIRYEKEIGLSRVFDDITATVTQSNNPLLAVGATYKGSHYVEKIEPPLTQAPDGRVIQGDVAYRVTNRFVNDEITLALGFHIWTEYYIDFGQNAFSAIIANVGDDDLMYFIGSYVGRGDDPDVTATYNANIKPILTRNCTSCHGANSAPRANLTSYAAVKAVGADVVRRVIDNSMPLGGPALSDSDKDLFRAWKNADYPEN